MGWQGDIVADSAEPKSIQEIRNMGYWAEPAQKGADSIIQSIDILKRYQLNVTRHSSALVKELNSYKWKEDKVPGTKEKIPRHTPIDFLNHAIDAIRYVALNKLSTGTGEFSINY
jgi:phage terminase large subunit